MPRTSGLDMSFAKLCGLYLQKAEKKGRTRAELDAVMRRLTGYDQTVLDRMAEDGTSFGAFLTGAPARAPARDKITGVVCGVRVEEVADPVLREMRRLDKLVEELARGKVVETAIRG